MHKFLLNSKIITIFLFFFVIFYSCTQNSTVINDCLLFSEERTEVKMSDLISDYSFIELETLDKNLILDASMIRIWKDRIFILDCFAKNKTVWAYDIQGKYLGNLGTLGPGPGEYIMPMSLVIDEANDRVLIKDVAQNKLLFYDASTLSFIKELRIPFYSDCFDYLSPNKLIWYVGSGCANEGDYQKHIQITDMELSVLSNHIPRMDFPKRGMYNVMTYFHRFENNVYFHHPFNNDVYSYDLSADTVNIQYKVDWKGLNYPPFDYVRANRDNIIKRQEEDHLIQYFELLENSDKSMCYFGKDNQSYLGVYDKNNQSGYYVQTDKIKDDLGILKFVRPKTVYQDKFVNVVYAEDLSLIPENSIIYPLVKNKAEGGNPILLLYK